MNKTPTLFQHKALHVVLATALTMTMGVGVAYASTSNGPSSSFYGDSGFSYQGYSSMTYDTGSNPKTASATQRVSCTSTAAPIGNMRAMARLCNPDYLPIVSSGWVSNSSTYGQYSWLAASTYTAWITPGQNVYSAGFSSCWKNYGWYDVLTGASSPIWFSALEMRANDSGQVYGNILDADMGLDLDLVKVVATDGVVGYVYYDELVAAETRGMTNPEEAVACMSEKKAASTAALQSALIGNLDGKVLNGAPVEVTAEDSELILEAYNAILSNGATLEIDDLAAEILAELPASATIGLSINSDVLAQSIIEATESVFVYIPVYAEDGETEVGLFPIGSL